MTDKNIYKIQAGIRGFLARIYYYDLRSQSDKLIKLTKNNTTLLGDTLEEVSEKNLFYCVYDSNSYYGFNLEEIYEWICKLNNKTNPYTNNILPEITLRQIRRLYQKEDEEDAETLEAKILNQNYIAVMTDLFIKIESKGCYADIEGYKELSYHQLGRFFQSIYEYDIVKELIDEEEYNKIKELYGTIINNLDSTKLRLLINYFKYQILIIFTKIFDTANSESLALIFTVELSEILNEINNTSIYNLINNIIQYNTFSEGNYDEDE